MQIEPTVSLGNIINIAVSVGAILLATWKIVSRLGVMEMKLDLLWSDFKKRYKMKEGTETND